MRTWSFDVRITCEGEIADDHLPRETVQKFLNNLIDKSLTDLERQTENLKLNIWRSEPVSLFRKLKF